MKTFTSLVFLSLLFFTGCVSAAKPREVLLPATQAQIREAVLRDPDLQRLNAEILIDSPEALHFRLHTSFPDSRMMTEIRYEFRSAGSMTAVSLGVLTRTETFGDDGKWHTRDQLSERSPVGPSLDDLKMAFAR